MCQLLLTNETTQITVGDEQLYYVVNDKMSSDYKIRYSQVYTIHENQIIYDSSSESGARYYQLSVAKLTEGKLIVKSFTDGVAFDVTYSSTVVLPQPSDDGTKTTSGTNSVEMEIDKDAMNQHTELYIQVHSNVSCSYSIEFVTDSNMQ